MSKEVALFIVTVGGLEFHSAAGVDDRGKPMTLEDEWRDQETQRLTLHIWDGVTEVGNDQFAPIFNALPNPLCVENVPVEAWMGWEGETLVKVFGGYFVAKKLHHLLSTTEIVALHEHGKLKRVHRTKALQGLTVKELIVKLAAEEGLVARFDSAIAGDAALNTPASVFLQKNETNWSHMLRYLDSLGYIVNTINRNVLMIHRDKSTGDSITVERGDGQLIDLDLRYEQRQGPRAGRRKAHAHEPKPGKAWRYRGGFDCGSSTKHVTTNPPAIAKKKKEHIAPFAKHSVAGIAKKIEKEGDEMTIKIRLRPELRNEERIVMSGYGPEIDGTWDTASVIHRCGREAATTTAACWREK